MALVHFRNRFPDLFNRFMDNDLFDWSSKHFSNTNTTIPAVNIREDHDGYEVEMAAPGLEKKDFKVELNDQVLTISSVKQFENETNEGQRFTSREFSYQSFSRSFTLPNTVEQDNIKAQYEDGLLRIRIPKKEEAKAKPPKQIAIQ